MNSTFWVVSAVAVAACAHTTPAGRQTRPSGDECYSSRNIPWAIADTSAYSPRSWLVLTADFSSFTAFRLKAAIAYDHFGNSQAGTWWQDGDTLRLDLHALPSVSFALVRTSEGLSGTGASTTALLAEAAPARLEGTRRSWVARFDHVDCAEHPRGRR